MADFYDDPEFYDSLFRHEAHADFYRDVCGNYEGNILELACGTGQVIGNMQSLPNALFGTDLSEVMVAEATRKYGSTERITFAIEDMRRFSHCRTYDVVFVARNSFLHLHSCEEIRAALRCIAQCLSPEGVFAFDVFNPNLSVLSKSADPALVFEKAEHHSEGPVDVYSSSNYDEATQVVHSEWWFVDSQNKRTEMGTLDLRCIYPQELLFILENSGFELCHRYGSLTKEPFDACSGRQVCICKRCG